MRKTTVIITQMIMIKSSLFELLNHQSIKALGLIDIIIL